MTAAPPLAAGDCVFLDLDGTLLHLRDDPAPIRADAALLDLLASCAAYLGGALAVVSGRTIADLDTSFAPLHLPAAGIHGLQHRGADGVTTTLPVDTAPLHAAARRLATALEELPMTQLEDKGASLALHWRRAPQSGNTLRQLAARTLQDLGPGYRLLEGDCVVELVPRVADKGDAVRAFLREAPFHGRRPCFIGDDITDLPGFAAARAAGGHGIAVGTRVSADYHLANVEAVRAWLARRCDG